METIVGFLMLALYIYLPCCFLRNSARILIKYFRDQKREHDIVNGSIVEIEKQVHKKAKGGWKTSFYAIYRFSYGGKSYRRYGYRLPVRLGPGLKFVAGTKLAVGDPVQVRVYRPQGEEELECRIEEPFFFWKSRLWVHVPVILIGLLFIGYGLYCAYLQITYLF